MYRQGTTPRAGRRRCLQHVPSNSRFESEDRLAYSTVTGSARWLGLSSVAEWAAPYWACLSALESARATGLAWAAAMEALMAFSSAAAWAYRLAPEWVQRWESEWGKSSG